MTPFLLRYHAPDQTVAYGSEGTKSASDLLVDAGRIAFYLSSVVPSVPAPRSVLLVFETDRYLFAASLLAVWSQDLVALIPPNHRRSTLSRLRSRPDVVALLHDTDSGLPVRASKLLSEVVHPAPDIERRFETLWGAKNTSIHLIQSEEAEGEDGQKDRVVALGAEEVRAELTRLEGYLPIEEGTTVASFVPLGHRFGLIAGLLAPLWSGGAFYRRSGSSLSLWVDELKEIHVDILVGVPRQLMTVARGSSRRGLVGVVSSGAPLFPEAAAEVRDRLGVPPTEFLCSNLLGMYAVRSSCEAWQCLPGVAAEPHSHGLEVSAVFGSSGVSEIVPDGRASEDGSFLVGSQPHRVLHGVDLERLENELVQWPSIVDAALERVDTSREEVLLLAAVVSAHPLREEVESFLWAAIPSEGATSVRVAVVPELSRDGLGRFPLTTMMALFGLGPRGSPRAERLATEEVESGAPDQKCFRLIVPKNYRWFDGHFEDYPVLPAAVQLHEIVVPCARKAGWLEGSTVSRFTKVKFARRIRPDTRITVYLTLRRPTELQFDLRDEQGSLTSGRLIVSRDSDA